MLNMNKKKNNRKKMKKDEDGKGKEKKKFTRSYGTLALTHKLCFIDENEKLFAILIEICSFTKVFNLSDGWMVLV